MALSNYKLGELISEVNRYNTDKLYGIDVVRGVSNHKTIMKTKASIDADVIAKFLIIQPDEFVYNPRTTRMGEKVGLAYNDTNCCRFVKHVRQHKDKINATSRLLKNL